MKKVAPIPIAKSAMTSLMGFWLKIIMITRRNLKDIKEMSVASARLWPSVNDSFVGMFILYIQLLIEIAVRNAKGMVKGRRYRLGL